MKKILFALIVSLFFQLSVQSQTPVANWLFDENKGSSVSDFTGNGNMGNITGTAIWVEGKYGRALSFTDPSNYIKLPASSVFSQPEFSFTFWAMWPEGIEITPGDEVWHALIEYHRGSWDAKWYGIFTEDNNIYFRDAGATLTPVAGQWYHIVVSIDQSGTEKIFIDAELVAENQGSPMELDEAFLTIGANNDGEESANVVLDDVRFYDTALTSVQIQEIMSDGVDMTGKFNVTVSAIGHGTVSPSSLYVEEGEKIKIEAAADSGYEFETWLQDHSGSVNPDSVVVNNNMLISAKFIEEGSTAVHKFYISPTGNNDNTGSKESPWATVQYGSSQLYPGDTLIIKSGVYTGESERITNSGNDGNYILILAEEGAVFELSTKNHTYGAFSIADANWVILDGITVKNTKSHAIKVLGECSHIIIRNCRTEHSAGCGILVQGNRGYPWDKKYYVSDILLDNNQIHWPQEAYFDGTPEDELPSHEDITLTQGVEHFEIRNCYVNAYDTVNYHGGPVGIDVKDGVRYGSVHHCTVINIPSSGIYLDAWNTYGHHIDFYNNYICNVTSFGMEAGAERGGPVDSIRIFNNIIVRCGSGGILSGNYNGGSGELQDKTHVDIFNNTIYQCGFGGDEGGTWQANGIFTESSWKESKLYNNILIDCYPNAMRLNRQDNNIVTNNCLYKTNGMSDIGDEGKNAVKEDPQFVDAANRDFHLKKTSPCINTGTDLGAPLFDYDGTTRPVQGVFDIGAYEIEGAADLNNYLPDNNINAYPNPFTGVITLSYTLVKTSIIKVSIIDSFGKEVDVLVDQLQSPGNYKIIWNGANLASGIYYYRMENGERWITKKIVLQK